MDIPTCGKCDGNLFELDDPCLCVIQSKEDVRLMMEYLVYVMEETSAAMKVLAGFGISVFGAELLQHALELESAGQQAASWVEGFSEGQTA